MEADKKKEKKKKERENLRILKQKALYMSNAGREFVMKSVNGNYELISTLHNHKTVRRGDLTPYELTFIQRVKRYVLENDIHMKFTEQFFPSDIKYMDVRLIERGVMYENVVEVDIDQAYWQTAHLLGVIDDKLYKAGCKGKISKEARMIALGTLAKKEKHFHYKGKKLLKEKEIRSELTENIWYTICKRVSDTMHEVIKALGDDYLFYWVDGIYMVNTTENIVKAMEIFMKYGYDSKFKAVEYVEFHDTGFVVKDIGGVENKREFNYPLPKEKLTYTESLRLRKICERYINGGR